MFLDFMYKIIELLTILRKSIVNKTLITMLMRPISDRIKSFKEMYIIDKRFELRIKKNNTKKFPGMKILEFKNNKKCKTKIHKHPKMRPFEKNKLEYLNIIHLDYYMKEIDTSF